MKKTFEKLRQGPRAKRYAVMIGIQVVFFALISLFAMVDEADKVFELTKVALMLVLFCFSLVHGVLAAEITDGFVVANVVFALLGGVFFAFIFKGVVDVAQSGAFVAYLKCAGYFLRYSFSSFVVSVIVKNTK